MAENYSLNSGFGLNVSNQRTKKQPTQQAQTVESFSKSVGDFVDSMTSYVAKYENVFNGDVEREINMYSRQAMIVGMNLKNSDSTIRRFDVNI